MIAAPLVSVIIPAYNAEKFILESVSSVLGQSYDNLEAIVVNDGSTDGTFDVLKPLMLSDARLRVLQKANGGLSSARNAGINDARGDFICFLDADDIFLTDKLERQLAFLSQFPECGLVYSDHYIGNEHVVPILLDVKVPPIKFPEILIYRNWFAPLSPLIRKAVIEQTGFFDETLSASEDWDYWIRCSEQTTFCYLPGPVGVYRTHPAQMHNNYDLMRKHYFAVAFKHFGSIKDKWRLAQAAIFWCDAKHAWGLGNYFDALLNLSRFMLKVRSKYQAYTIHRLL